MRMFSLWPKHWFWSFNYRSGGNIILRLLVCLQMERVFEKREAVTWWCFPLQNIKWEGQFPLQSARVTVPCCSEQVMALASFWCKMGKYYNLFLSLTPMRPGQPGFLGFIFLLCAALQTGWGAAKLGAGGRRCFPLPQGSLCVFKGPPPRGEPV